VRARVCKVPRVHQCALGCLTRVIMASSGLAACGRAVWAAGALAAEGAKGLLVWAPVLGGAMALLVLAGREAARPAYPACEIPLVPWALTAGSAAAATAVLAFVHFLSSTCVLLCPPVHEGEGEGAAGEYDPKSKAAALGEADGKGWWAACRCRRVVVARVNVDPHAAPSGPALFMTSATAVLAMFLIAWCYVGAVWLLPLRESPAGHKCHPALFTVAYVVVIAVIVGSILIAMLSAALACCGCIFAAAVGTAVRSFIDTTLTYLGLASQRPATAAAAGEAAAAPPVVPGPSAPAIDDAEYPEVQPATGVVGSSGADRERLLAPSPPPTSTTIAVPPST